VRSISGLAISASASAGKQHFSLSGAER